MTYTHASDVYEYHIEQVTEVVPTEYTIQEKNLQTEVIHYTECVPVTQMVQSLTALPQKK